MWSVREKSDIGIVSNGKGVLPSSTEKQADIVKFLQNS